MLNGEVIRRIRSQLGITQEQLAHDLNISFSTLNRWENGHTKPSRLARIRLIEYFKGKNIEENELNIFQEL